LKWIVGPGCASVSKPREFLARAFNARAQVGVSAERSGPAKALGLTMPQSILLRADEVIE
jgi:hypothetical protein